MNCDDLKHVADFLCSGILVLSIICIISCAMIFGKKVRPVFSVGKNCKSNCQENKIPICSTEQKYPKLAITFEAVQSQGELEQILSILKKNQVSATFFASGQWMNKHRKEVRKITACHHELGSFGEHYMSMVCMSLEECKEEISKPRQRMEAISGKKMNLFRVPYDQYNFEIMELLKKYHFYPIKWNVDSLDWKEYGTEAIVSQVLLNPNLNNGAILRFHIDGKYTPDALRVLIPALKEKGYHFVKVSQMIYKKNYYIDELGRQHQYKNVLAK